MDIELKDKCREFSLSEKGIRLVEEVEDIYNQFAGQNGIERVSLLEYITNYIVDTEELSELTERDRFFYGLGVVTISLGIKENNL